MQNEDYIEDYEVPLTAAEENALRMQRRRFLRNKAHQELALQNMAPFACIVLDRATGDYFLMPN